MVVCPLMGVVCNKDEEYQLSYHDRYLGYRSLSVFAADPNVPIVREIIPSQVVGD